MKVYRVGGAIRDELLGRRVQDHDYVVVGATPEQMTAQGFRPVGKDFPVFLHPETHEEYALARTERKSGRGYKGFTVHTSPEVTLEEDLARRDLTINAMARDEAGTLIDPFSGATDLADGILRHVSPAFAEDPVRILRVARFAARFGFRVADDTMALMRFMVDSGEADHLVPERVWQEFSRGLMEARPSAMFAVLAECGALARVAREWEAWIDPRHTPARRTLATLDRSAEAGAPLTVRFAVAAHRVGEHLPALCERLRAPTDCRELSVLASRTLGAIWTADLLDAAASVDLLQRADAYRRGHRFEELLHVAALEDGRDPRDYPPARHLRRSLAAARSVDSARIAADRDSDVPVNERIRQGRIAAVAAMNSND
ncbi:MAG: multifunctional CCA tRNA nucleotidyl transferase/2'3'-cyclic phosphodiesterase/2'nucleotidase/phosphatase [Burkholderiales bacterium]